MYRRYNILTDVVHSLLSLEAQDKYYDEILRRCVKLQDKFPTSCSNLSEVFDGLNLLGQPPGSADTKRHEEHALSIIAKVGSVQSVEVSVITQAMRKLREAIVATRRIDDEFACRAYVFMIRATILLQYHEAYHPALIYLLRSSQTQTSPFIQGDLLRQLVEYQVLDLACRQRDLPSAYQLSLQHGLRKSKTFILLKAMARGDWVLHRKTTDTLDRFQRCMVQVSSDVVLQHALSCIGKTYLQIEEQYLQKWFRRSLNELPAEQKVNWSSNADMVIIRQIKRK